MEIILSFIIVFVILIFLIYENKKLRNTTDSLKTLISESIDLIRKESKCSNEEINKNIDIISETTNAKIAEVEQSLENTIDDFTENSKNTNQFISDTKKEFEKTAEILSRQFVELTQSVEKIIEENKNLRKKLEFFTEIEEDSKNLTENDDAKARESLLEKALEEIKTNEFEVLQQSENDSLLDEDKQIQKTIAADELFTNNLENTSNNEAKEIDSPRSLSFNTPSILDDEQKMAFSIMNTTNENLFITGKAGTGKSFLLDIFVKATSKKTLKLAPTGIAALNVGGVTLHSTFGYYNLVELSLEEISASTLRIKSEKIKVLKTVDTIIIDEISMVRVDIFDKIDKILRILNKSAKPFGGKQVIVFGDLFQLPPITNKNEEKYLLDYYNGIHFFTSNAYKNGEFNFIELTVNHRQKEDIEYFNILNRMREGKSTNEDISKLNQRFINDKDKIRRVLTLFPKKADAEKLNKEELEKIEAKEYVYKSKIVFNEKNDQTPNLEAKFPITEELHLKRGALVMMVANDSNKRWVNGTMGIVKELTNEKIVVTIDGTNYEIGRYIFTEREAIYEEGKIKYKEVLKIEQFPIVLAYAITIHKSQGMTYKKVACDISECFAPGQAYVALSRCGSMNGLYLLKQMDTLMINTDKQVVDFYLSQSSERTINRFR